MWEMCSHAASFNAGKAMPMSRNRIRRMKLQHQAEGYLELGMPQQALDVLARLDPADADWHTLYLQGEALRGLGRCEEALPPLARVIEAEPENVRAWLALAWCQKRVRRLDQAIFSMESALAADPEEPLIHYNLACYWSLAGGKRQALGYLEQALAMDGSFRRMIDAESDFDSLRSDPDFQSLCNGSQTTG
jgi:Flp pilus assembly protein TadD